MKTEMMITAPLLKPEKDSEAVKMPVPGSRTAVSMAIGPGAAARLEKE